MHVQCLTRNRRRSDVRAHCKRDRPASAIAAIELVVLERKQLAKKLHEDAERAEKLLEMNREQLEAVPGW
jgi:hypothetical protein